MIGTDCTSSFKPNYHTITTMTFPFVQLEKKMSVYANQDEQEMTIKAHIIVSIT
jgi:hypothetical protein